MEAPEMIIIRPYRGGGWLTPHGARKKSAALSRRLGNEVKNLNGIFITLTVDPQGKSPQEHYEEHKRNKAVSRFLSVVSERAGKSLKGKWICKLEFTDNGYPHYHIIIKDVPYIHYSILTEAWARGHVWVNKLSPKHASYVSKSGYLAKSFDMPTWTLDKPVNYFKFVRTSPGFWSDGLSRRTPSNNKETLDTLLTRIDSFKPVGLQIEESDTRVTIACTSNGYRETIDDISIGEAGYILCENQIDITPYENGFSVSDDIDNTISTLALAAAGRRRRAPLNLIKGLNRAWVMEMQCS